MERLAKRLLIGGRALAVVGVAGLAVFHLRLFIDDIIGGQLADPGLSLRWLLAGALVTALVALARAGASLSGTRGIAALLLVVMLHVPAMAPDRGPDVSPMPAEALATLLQTAAAATGLVLILASRLGRRSWQALAVAAWAPLAVSPTPRVSFAFAQPLAPRPPPRDAR